MSKFGFLVYIIKLFLHQVNVFLHVVLQGHSASIFVRSRTTRSPRAVCQSLGSRYPALRQPILFKFTFANLFRVFELLGGFIRSDERGGNGIHSPPCVIPTSMNVQRSRHYSLNGRLCILSFQDIVGFKLTTETDTPSYHSYGKLKYGTTNVYTVQNQCSFHHMYHQSIISQQTRSECKITGTGGRDSSRQDTHKI